MSHFWSFHCLLNSGGGVNENYEEGRVQFKWLFFSFYFDKGSADVMKYLSYHVNIHGKLFLMDLKKKILQDESNVLITGGKLINSFV